MTEEEYQNKILEYENTLKDLNLKLTSLAEIENTQKNEIENLKDSNNKLKEHNMNLFLKVTDQIENINKPIENKPPITNDNDKNIDDILNIMLKKGD